MWKETINHRKYVRASLKWCIGDGRKVFFWTDNWVYTIHLVSFMDDNNLHYIKLYAKVNDFINYENKEWNINLVSTVIHPNIIAGIKTISIPYSSIEDRFLWGYSKDGKFTLKSATWAMRKPLVHPRYKILNWIWKLNLVSKIKVFLWLAISETLPTCEFLIIRRLEITNCCYLCNQSGENIDHIFKSCPFI